MMYCSRRAQGARNANRRERLACSSAPVVHVARLLILSALLLAILMPQASAQTSPQTPPQLSSSGPAVDYLVYVVCESADKVVLLRFGPHGFHQEHETHIGLLPLDIKAPKETRDRTKKHLVNGV